MLQQGIVMTDMKTSPLDAQNVTSPSTASTVGSGRAPSPLGRLPRLRAGQYILLLSAITLCVIPFYTNLGESAKRRFRPRIFGNPSFCKNKLVYMYDLPAAYNTNLLRLCSRSSLGRMPCHFLQNEGLGKVSDFGYNREGPQLGPGTGWYNTWDLALELYFFQRIQYYPCLTNNPSRASAFYVPFFPTLHLLGQKSYKENVDIMYDNLLTEIEQQPYFARHGGRDHFIVIGHRTETFKDYGAIKSGMLFHASFRSMIKLTAERGTTPADKLEIAIPYLTNFHPTSNVELETQQDWLSQGAQRDIFVSMAIGMKYEKRAITRTFLARQCSKASQCAVLYCTHPADPKFGKQEGLNRFDDCSNPNQVLNLYYHSEFCLHPPGEGFTRRAIFDSLLAGCIPVFFTDRSAKLQYMWHMPTALSSWAVFVPDKVLGRLSVVRFLRGITKKKKREIRMKIVDMLPRITYASPWKKYPSQGYNKSRHSFLRKYFPGGSNENHTSKGPTIVSSQFHARRQNRIRASKKIIQAALLDQPDAFDVAIDAVLKMVKNNTNAEPSELEANYGSTPVEVKSKPLTWEEE